VTLEETLHQIKMRLKDQQAKLGHGQDLVQVRAELDALWACVEVLAQALDGQENIEVPNYFGDPKRRLRGSVFTRKRHD